MQGERTLIPMYRNERNHLRLMGRAGLPHGGPRTPVNLARQPWALARGTPRSSMRPATRKLVSYARAG